MTDCNKKRIRNHTAEFLTFIGQAGQAGQQITRHTAIREANAALVPVMLGRLFSGVAH